MIGYRREMEAARRRLANRKRRSIQDLGSGPSSTGPAERIRGSRLIVVERGGHLLLGSERLIQREIAAFMTEAASLAHGQGRGEP